MVLCVVEIVVVEVLQLAEPPIQAWLPEKWLRDMGECQLLTMYLTNKYVSSCHGGLVKCHRLNVERSDPGVIGGAS